MVSLADFRTCQYLFYMVNYCLMSHGKSSVSNAEPEDMFSSGQSYSSADRLQTSPSIHAINEEHTEGTEMSVHGMNSPHYGTNERPFCY